MKPSRLLFCGLLMISGLLRSPTDPGRASTSPISAPSSRVDLLAPGGTQILAAGDENWADIFAMKNGTDGIVRALVVDQNGNLYVGGSFTTAGGINANNIAKWDAASESWSPLGDGVNGSVSALAVDRKGNLYAGGDFTMFFLPGAGDVGGIARWDGAGWSALGGGGHGNIQALAVDHDGNVYAGGTFFGVGYVNFNQIGKWDAASASWSPLGNGLDWDIEALAVDNDDNLYAGGKFTGSGGKPVNHIARWDASSESWSAPGGGIDYWVHTLALGQNGDLYVGGGFGGGTPDNHIARWNRFTASWSALGSGVEFNILALAVDGSGNLYAGGYSGRIAKWNGNSWTSLGNGLSGGNLSYAPTAYGLVADSQGKLYVGGDFSAAGGKAANRIARWNGSDWSALGNAGGNGMTNPVIALKADHDGNLYAGGMFIAAGDVSARQIAKWDSLSERWMALGSGMEGGVQALEIDRNGSPYAGGDWYPQGVKRWNSVSGSWEIVSNRIVSGSVFALKQDGNGNLYIGGDFFVNNGTEGYVVKWDGTPEGWSALGHLYACNYFPRAFALAVVGNDLYVGGNFDYCGGEISHVARWDSSSGDWSAMGSGLNGPVSVLAADQDGNLYAGGSFTMAGGTTMNHIARWDSVSGSWSPLGSGVNGAVTSLAVDRGGNLYVGGNFTTAGEMGAANVAKWNTSSASWSALGSGTNGAVYALAVVGNDLYAGGGFTIAGGKASSYIARWRIPPTLQINHAAGKPGSYFAVSGFDFPAGVATVTVNGRVLTNTLPVSNLGQLAFQLNTSSADAGRYLATVSVNPRVTVDFTLDPNEPLRPLEGSGPVLDVPEGIAFTKFIYLPLIMRSASLR